MGDLVRPEDLAASLKDKVEAKIRNAFVGLITDEQWTQMTQAALDRFVQPQVVRDYRHGDQKTRPSPFDQVIEDVLRERMTIRIKAELDKPEYFEEWPYGTSLAPKPGEAVKEILKRLAPELVACLFSQVTQQAVNVLRDELRRVT